MTRWRLPRWPSRWRITAWMIVVVFTIVALAGTVAVMLVKHRFVRETDGDLRAEMRGAVAAIETLGPEVLVELREAAPDALGRSQYAIVLLGPDGPAFTLPATSGDAALPAPDLDRFTFTELRARAGTTFGSDAVETDLEYRVTTGQLDDGKLLVMAAPLDELERSIRVIAGALLLVALVTAGVLVVVIALVTARLTRPLEAMITTAEGIGSGDLETRVPHSDVDDVDRLAGALNAMLERLEVAFRERDASETKLRRFVADASHELRTPLAAILGYVELQHHAGADDPILTERALGRIGSEAERMRQMVEELLMLARLDQTRPTDLREVDLADLAGEAVADATAIDRSRPIELLTTGAPAIVLGERTSLRQALDNLLGNTREHTPAGTHVTVSVTRTAESVAVSVSDDGPGIPAEAVEHVFERFYRADPSRDRSGGAGLGLSIVQAIADHHRGEVSVTSAPGTGTTFTLRLPVGPGGFDKLNHLES